MLNRVTWFWTFLSIYIIFGLFSTLVVSQLVLLNFENFCIIIYLKELLDAEKGYYDSKIDSIALEVHVVADAPHGVR